MCVMRGRMKRMSQEYRAERATGARLIRPCMTHMIDATTAWRISTDNAQLTLPHSIHIFRVVRGREPTACWNGTPHCWHFVTISLCSWRRLPWRTHSCAQHIPDKTLGLCLSLERCGSDNTRHNADVFGKLSFGQWHRGAPPREAPRCAQVSLRKTSSPHPFCSCYYCSVRLLAISRWFPTSV